MSPVSSKTLFVRCLSYTTSDKKLENVFSEYGPVNRCFVVKEKGSDTCRGFGYVTFAVREDAEKAMKDVKSVENRKVFIQFAEHKLDKRKEKRKAKENTKNEKNEKDADKKVLVLRGLDETVVKEDVKQTLKRAKNLRSIEYPATIDGVDGAALVTFATVGSAIKARKKFSGKMIKQCKIQTFLLADKDQARPRQKQPLKKSRLIVRNLPFQCSESDLTKIFSEYGELSEVVIPKKGNGKVPGFAFVQFNDVGAAAEAVDKVNMLEVTGRKIAVDWALPKQQYMSLLQKRGTGHSTDSSESEKKDAASESDEGERESSVGDDDGSDKEGSISDGNNSNAGSDDSDLDSDNSDINYDSASEERSGQTKSKNERLKVSNDVGEGKTVFVRNLSYDAEEADIEDIFKQFGKIVYVRVCVDPLTEHPKGTAFVKFATVEAAEECLQKNNTTDSSLILNHRKLLITKAINREEASKFTLKEKEPKDNRNLHLAREGLIRMGTQAATGTPKPDLLKRQQLEITKRQKLKNLNIFISPVRLCVRNLPKSVDDKSLKEIFAKVVESKNMRIVKARVMRDRKQVNSKGIAKSLGYGFVEFAKHEDALSALHNTNNNPNVFPNQRRLIVEFSLENRTALNAQKRKRERSALKQGAAEKRKIKHDGGGSSKKLKQDSETAVKRSEGKNQKHQKDSAAISTEKRKKLPNVLPSHFGPKIRHKARAVKSNKPTGKKSRQQVRKDVVKPEKQRNIRVKQKTSDSLDKLINQYKNKFAGIGMKESKWFDS